MKIDKRAVKEFARREMLYNTHDPFEATLRGLETWMGRNKLHLVTTDVAMAGESTLELCSIFREDIDNHILKEVQPPETGEALSAEGEPN